MIRFITNIIASKNLDINEILSLDAGSFLLYSDYVYNWLRNQYPKFINTILKTKQHGNESLLDHVFNMLKNFSTDGLTNSQIFNSRVAIIHHDIDRVQDLSETKNKKSENAADSWEQFISPQINIENGRDEIQNLISNHDIMGYFFRTFKGLRAKGLTDEQIYKFWISKHPNVN